MARSTLSFFIVRVIAAALAGCSAGPTSGEHDDGAPDAALDDSSLVPAPAGTAPVRAEDTLPIELEPAPSTAELLAKGIEPGAIDIPAELSRTIVVEKRIIGADTRTPVTNTKVSPYSTIATLLVTFPGAKSSVLCTGSIIGPDAVLTAGHCAYSRKYGAFARNIRVLPGSYPAASGRPAEPFGSTSGRKLYVPYAYRTTTDFWQREANDYAVVRTTSAIGKLTGIRKYGVMSAPAVGRAVSLVGYHGDLCKAPPCMAGIDAFVMNASRDKIRQLFTNVFNHYADSTPGASGSPLVSDGVDANKIFAVHVAGIANPSTGAEWNMGVLITKTAFSNLKTWVSAP